MLQNKHFKSLTLSFRKQVNTLEPVVLSSGTLLPSKRRKKKYPECKGACYQRNSCFRLGEAVLMVFLGLFFFFLFFSFPLPLEFKARGVLGYMPSLSIEFLSITDFSTPKLEFV